MHPWLAPLHASFRHHADAGEAAAMEAYMKDHFPFFGIKASLRRQLVKEHIAVHGAPDLAELPAIARSAFALPEREMHQVAVDLMMKQAKKLTPADLPWIEELITTRSWWDSVDALAVHVVGTVLKRHPKEVARWNRRWIASPDLWLNRTAILFQNRWKEHTDRALLFANIERHAGHTDFFIRKAIGWALRELGATDPRAVKAFVKGHRLSPLSEREALRRLPEDLSLRDPGPSSVPHGRSHFTASIPDGYPSSHCLASMTLALTGAPAGPPAGWNVSPGPSWIPG